LSEEHTRRESLEDIGIGKEQSEVYIIPAFGRNGEQVGLGQHFASHSDSLYYTLLRMGTCNLIRCRRLKIIYDKYYL
jgi:hypothetical protein